MLKKLYNGGWLYSTAPACQAVGILAVPRAIQLLAKALGKQVMAHVPGSPILIGKSCMEFFCVLNQRDTLKKRVKEGGRVGGMEEGKKERRKLCYGSGERFRQKPCCWEI